MTLSQILISTFVSLNALILFYMSDLFVIYRDVNLWVPVKSMQSSQCRLTLQSEEKCYLEFL